MEGSIVYKRPSVEVFILVCSYIVEILVDGSKTLFCDNAAFDVILLLPEPLLLLIVPLSQKMGPYFMV